MKKKLAEEFTCSQCGCVYAKWVGQCHQCEAWNTVSQKSNPSASPSARSPLKLSEIEAENSMDRRVFTHLPFLDRVLGGGLDCSSAVLLAGEPGIGKSTLVFQMMSLQKEKVLYVSAEESPEQVAQRFRHFTPFDREKLFILAETELSRILEEIEKLKPSMVIIDSIQMVDSVQLDRSRGSMVMLREATEALIQKTKSMNTQLWLIGHVNKDGDIAGPKVLEHLVDTVLLFLPAEDAHLRILQTSKNRFGPSGELAVLEMTAQGLNEQKDMSSFWTQNHWGEVSGFALSMVKMGSRFFCVEIQALVVESHFPSPRRSTSGYDINRLHLLLAVLEKKMKIPLSRLDVYVNVVGGLKVSDPASDLAVAASVISAFFDKPISQDRIYCAEIGLTGELRPVSHTESRLKAAFDLSKKEWWGAPMKGTLKSELTLRAVSSVSEALSHLKS